MRPPYHSFADVPDTNDTKRAFPQRVSILLHPQTASHILVHQQQSAREAEDVAERGVCYGVCESVGRVADANAKLRRRACVNRVNASAPFCDHLEARRTAQDALGELIVAADRAVNRRDKREQFRRAQTFAHRHADDLHARRLKLCPKLFAVMICLVTQSSAKLRNDVSLSARKSRTAL